MVKQGIHYLSVSKTATTISKRFHIYAKEVIEMASNTNIRYTLNTLLFKEDLLEAYSLFSSSLGHALSAERHNGAARSEMIQVLRFLRFAKEVLTCTGKHLPP